MKYTARRKIIFDMDGVITGEERFWDAAALTVWELLFSEEYLGIGPPDGMPAFKKDPAIQEIAAIRRIIFCRDRVISFFKQRAVNSNWDLAFFAFAFQLAALFRHLAARGFFFDLDGEGKGAAGAEGTAIGKLSLIRPSFDAVAGDNFEPSFAAVLGDWSEEAQGGGFMNKLLKLLPPAYGQVFAAGSIHASPLWQGVREIFQDWYWGGKKPQLPPGKEALIGGKSGLFFREEPIIEAARIKTALGRLSSLGWELGIATGRPSRELHHPLEQMGIRSYFADDSIVTHDQVARAEKVHGEDFPRISLGKPHPFSFLKAYWGGEIDEKELIVSPPLPLPGNCWVVGDTMADFFAARDAGAHFIGVLTGPGGTANEELFLRQGAVAVLPDMTRLPDFFARLKK